MSAITIDSLLTIMPEGSKYPGKTVDHVLIVEPLYMFWFASNIGSTTDNMMEKIKQRVADHKEVEEIDYKEHEPEELDFD